jgi:hypothetical protein
MERCHMHIFKHSGFDLTQIIVFGSNQAATVPPY